MAAGRPAASGIQQLSVVKQAFKGIFCHKQDRQVQDDNYK